MATNDRALDPRLNWAALSQVQRDAAYDNNAAVKNSAALIAERNEASATLRASRKSILDVPYGDRERTKITSILPPTRRHLAWSSCTAATGNAIPARCLPCLSRASARTAGRSPFPDTRWPLTRR